jgi:hypothetical protein
MSTSMDENIDSKLARSLVLALKGGWTKLTLLPTVDPTLRDTEEQIVVDKIINEGIFSHLC